MTVQNFKLSVNTELTSNLTKSNYSLEDLIISYCIGNEKKEVLKSYLTDRSSDQKLAILQRLERKLLVYHLADLEVFDIDNYTLTEEGVELLSDYSQYFLDVDIIISNGSEEITQDELDEFVQQYLEIYPKSRNKAGEILKSNEVDVKNRMKLFLAKYKKYTKDIILQATKNYIQQQANTRYEFCSSAHYFIEKKGFGSKLAAECENVLSGDSQSISSFTDQLM